MSLLPLSSDSNFGGSSFRKRGRFVRFIIPTLLVLAVLGWVLAAAININLGGTNEFGQGSIQTVACDKYLTITPESSMDPSTGIYYLDSVEIGDIGNPLIGINLTLNIFNSSGASVLSTPLGAQFTAVRFGMGSVLTFMATENNGITPNIDFVIDTQSYGGGPNQERGVTTLTFLDLTSQQIVSSNNYTYTIETEGEGNC